MPRPRNAQRAARSRRRLALTLGASAAAAAVVVGISTGALASVPADDRVVATIDDADVTRGELLFHMQRVRAAVEDRAGESGEHAASDATLRDAALDEIEQDRAVLALAREHDLTDLETFADLQAAREATNSSRAEQVANGEIVYGLTSFSLDEFHSRTMSELQTALLDSLSSSARPELVVSDVEVTQYLGDHASEWAAGATTYRATRLEISESAGLDAAAVERLANGPGGIDSAAEAVAEASVTTVVIDAEGRIDAADAALSPDAIAELRTLVPGEMTAPQTHRGGWAVYRLDEASVDEAAALTTYASRIRAVLLEERFDALLAARRAQQHTDLLPTEWNEVKMEGSTR